MKSFFNWLNAQPEAKGVMFGREAGGALESHSGAVQFLLKWLRAPGSRITRMPKKDPGDYAAWQGLIEKKAAKAQKEALLACLATAWGEWQTSRAESASETWGKTRVVEGAVARLRRRVWGMDQKGTEQKKSTITVHEFAGPVAKVTRGVRITKDLGGYDGVQLIATVEVPCYPEELEEANQFAKDFCEQEVQADLGRFIESFRIMRTRSGHVDSKVSEKEDDSEKPFDDTPEDDEQPTGATVDGDEGGPSNEGSDNDEEGEPVEWESPTDKVDFKDLGL